MIIIKKNIEKLYEDMPTRSRKAIADMCFMDDFFSKRFLTKECVELIFKIALNNPNIKFKRLNRQVRISNPGHKKIILDFLGVDKNNNYYNLELNNYLQGSKTKRAQSYGHIITARRASSNEEDDVPDVKILFIDRHDMMKLGAKGYEINSYLKEIYTNDDMKSPLIKAEDNVQINFMNVEIGVNDNDYLGMLKHDLTCQVSERMYFDEFRKAMEKGKGATKGVNEMKGAMEVFEDEVREEQSIEIAKNLLNQGITIDIVIESTHLPEEKVLNLMKDLKLV